MIDIAGFRERYPEYSDETLYPDERIQMAIDDATIWMGTDEDRWLDYYDLAQYCLTAHFLAVSTITSSGDISSLYPVSHQEVDSTVIKSAVGNVTPSNNNLYSTAYGQCYANYLKMAFGGIIGV